MDVRFEKITQLGSSCSRYIPILEEKVWTPEIREFYTLHMNTRKDLSVLPVDEYWRHFLDFYTLSRIEESKEDAWVRFYTLKPGITHQLPKKLAIIFAVPQTGVRLDNRATVLESKPNQGRMMEFILLEGSFSFNEGTFFRSYWATYTL